MKSLKVLGANAVSAINNSTPAAAPKLTMRSGSDSSAVEDDSGCAVGREKLRAENGFSLSALTSPRCPSGAAARARDRGGVARTNPPSWSESPVDISEDKRKSIRQAAEALELIRNADLKKNSYRCTASSTMSNEEANVIVDALARMTDDDQRDALVEYVINQRILTERGPKSCAKTICALALLTHEAFERFRQDAYQLVPPGRDSSFSVVIEALAPIPEADRALRDPHENVSC